MTLLELIKLIKQHLRLMIVLPLAFALAMSVVAFTMLDDNYTATTSMYVLLKEDNSDNGTSHSDLNASQMLANDVAALATSERIEKDTVEALGISSLSGYEITVESSSSTRVITLKVAGGHPESTAKVANVLAKNISKVAQEVMNVNSVNVIDPAVTPEDPSGPNRLMYVIVAFLLGIFMALAIIIVMDTLNTKVRSEEEIEELLGVPVIGRIPVMKGGCQ